MSVSAIDLISSLSARDKTELFQGLLDRERREARSLSVLLASALAANLKFLKFGDEAETVKEIERLLLLQDK